MRIKTTETNESIESRRAFVDTALVGLGALTLASFSLFRGNPYERAEANLAEMKTSLDRLTETLSSPDLNLREGYLQLKFFSNLHGSEVSKDPKRFAKLEVLTNDLLEKVLNAPSNDQLSKANLEFKLGGVSEFYGNNIKRLIKDLGFRETATEAPMASTNTD